MITTYVVHAYIYWNLNQVALISGQLRNAGIGLGDNSKYIVQSYTMIIVAESITIIVNIIHWDIYYNKQSRASLNIMPLETAIASDIKSSLLI